MASASVLGARLLALALFVGLAWSLAAAKPTTGGDGAEGPSSDDEDESAPLDAERAAARVCANKKVPIQSISDMLGVIAAVQLEDRKCKGRYLSAIYELQPILELERTDLCAESAFGLIRDYHFRFIQPMRQANRRPTQFEAMPRDLVKGQLHPEPRKYTVDFDDHEQVLLAPLAFRHFFLKFALQVSYQCKMNLLNNLRTDTQRLLNDKDREVMALFEKDSPLGRELLGAGGFERIDFDSVLYMPELDGRLAGGDGEEAQQPGAAASASKEQHLKTSAQENSALFQMIYTCKNRLKPLYDALIVPIVRLSKLGYDYQGSLGFSEREREFLAGAEMKNWLILVHVCEIFKNTVLVRVDQAAATAAGTRAAQKPHSLREELNRALDDEDAEDGTKAPAGGCGEGELVPASEAEVRELELQARLRETFKPIEYAPSVRASLGDRLMIERERDLDVELARKHGPASPLGLRGFLRRRVGSLKRQLAKLDLMKFAHYRRHSLWYSGLLNFISSLSNVASISITVLCLGGVSLGG